MSNTAASTAADALEPSARDRSRQTEDTADMASSQDAPRTRCSNADGIAMGAPIGGRGGIHAAPWTQTALRNPVSNQAFTAPKMNAGKDSRTQSLILRRTAKARSI